MLTSRFGDPSRVDDKLIDQWYDMWMREGQRAAILARLRSYSSADIVKVTAAVSVPTLILWGEKNPQAPVEQAEELRKMLTKCTRGHRHHLSGHRAYGRRGSWPGDRQGHPDLARTPTVAREASALPMTHRHLQLVLPVLLLMTGTASAQTAPVMDANRWNINTAPPSKPESRHR